jgi:hypothetical protein
MRGSRNLLSSARRKFLQLHHPDPPTQQQMQSFLNAVTTSFRRNLDNEYGIEKPGEDEASVSSGVADPSPRMAPRPRPIEKHMASLVNNPLFLARIRSPDLGPVAPAPAPAQRDPMDVFDEAVAKGLMTVKVATGCLEAKRRLIAKEAGLYELHPHKFQKQTPRKMDLVLGSMRTWTGHDVADRLLTWLFASGEEKRLEYLADKSFVSRLMVFLVAEGKDHVVWSWIGKLMQRGRVTDYPLARNLLYTLSATKLFEGESADSGLETIVDASNSYADHPLHKALLSSPWSGVASLTNNTAWQGSVASEALFNKFLTVSELLNRPTVELQVAHLHLHHPSIPTHHRATDYFATLAKKYPQSSARLPSLGKDEMRVVVSKELNMGFSAVNLMRIMGDIASALELERFVEGFYGKDLSERQSRFMATVSL